MRPSSVLKQRAILDAAEQSFLSGGYAAVTMDDVAQRSGVAKQTLYSHFGSKDALFVALVSSMTREAGDAIYDVGSIRTHEELVHTLEQSLGQQLDVVLTPRLLRLRRLVIGEVQRFPALARALAENGPHRAIASIADLLDDASRAGLLDIPDTRAAASQLNWLVMGEPVNDAMLLGDDAVPSAAARRMHVSRAVRTFMSAYSSRTAVAPPSG